MLSEERVKHMTRMAMYEKNESKQLQPALNYSRKDYVNLCVIVNVFIATVVFAILAVIVVGLLYTTVLNNLSLFGIVLGGVVALLLYVIYLFFYLRGVAKQADKKYTESRDAVRELKSYYDKLCAMYDEESAATTKLPNLEMEQITHGL